MLNLDDIQIAFRMWHEKLVVRAQNNPLTTGVGLILLGMVLFFVKPIVSLAAILVSVAGIWIILKKYLIDKYE